MLVRPRLNAMQGGKMNSLGRIFMIRRGLPVVLALLVLCSICMPCAAGQEQKEHEWG